MDVNSIDVAEKAALSAKKSPSAPAPKKPNSTVASSNSKDDFVTISREGKLSVEQVDPTLDPSSAPIEGESSVVPSESTEVSSQRKLSVTEDKQVILKIIDSKTKDVIKQVPGEEQVRLREAMRNIADDLLPPEQSE